jgi:UDP-glucose:(heptosyl)LPS alpha-1,3-glucosyltransferase
MNIAFGIFRLVPTGGLERHALRLAKALMARGHKVTMHTTAVGESLPEKISCEIVPGGGWTNHGAMERFSATLAAATAGRSDLIVGFQKLRGLDVLFCADPCYIAMPRLAVAKLMPRYRTMAALERACFGPGAGTLVLALSQSQRDEYLAAFGTEGRRVTVLPPTLDPAIRLAAPPDAAARAALRGRHGLAAQDVAWLWVGLQPWVKGLDRVMAALARRPEAVLFACGAEEAQRDVARLLAKARQGGFAGRIRMLGTVPPRVLSEIMTAADMLVHPSRIDVTAMVILEAMANGLPVIATANCGFAAHVSSADAGIVIPVPFDQENLDAALAAADAERRKIWSRNAAAYGANPRLYSGIAHACELIEAAAVRDPAAWQRAVAAAERRTEGG